MTAPKRPTRLDDARRLARRALEEAKPGADSDEPREYAYLLGSVEAALKILLDALDAQDRAER